MSLILAPDDEDDDILPAARARPSISAWKPRLHPKPLLYCTEVNDRQKMHRGEGGAEFEDVLRFPHFGKHLATGLEIEFRIAAAG